MGLSCSVLLIKTELSWRRGRREKGNKTFQNNERTTSGESPLKLQRTSIYDEEKIILCSLIFKNTEQMCLLKNKSDASGGRTQWKVGTTACWDRGDQCEWQNRRPGFQASSPSSHHTRQGISPPDACRLNWVMRGLENKTFSSWRFPAATAYYINWEEGETDLLPPTLPNKSLKNLLFPTLSAHPGNLIPPSHPANNFLKFCPDSNSCAELISSSPSVLLHLLFPRWHSHRCLLCCPPHTHTHPEC